MKNIFYEYWKLSKEFLKLWTDGEDRWTNDCRPSKSEEIYMR